MKKVYLVLIIVICIPLISVGQKRIQISNGYEKGLIVDGYKKGIWKYYDAGKLKLEIDYDSGKLIYLAKDTTKYAVKTSSGWRLLKLDIYPHYLGSTNEVLKIMAMNIRYPSQAIEKSIKGIVLIGFEINLQGHVENIRILKDIGSGCGEEVVRTFKLIPNFWLVARKGEKQFVSRYVLPVKFQIGKNSLKNKVDKKVIKHELESLKYNPTNYLPEIVVSAT